MAVTYNKINWDEETPITVANLDRIDVGIDEVVTQSNSNESRITTNEDDISNHEGRITTNEDDISSNEGRITTNEFKISNLITEVDSGTWEVFRLNALVVEEPPSDIEITSFRTNSNFHLRYIDNENDNTYTFDTEIEVQVRRRFILFSGRSYFSDLTDEYIVEVEYTVYEITLP